MIEKIIEELKDKKICILGFGIEGKSTYRFIRKYLPEDLILVVCDKYLKPEDIYEYKGDINLEFITGDNYLDNLENYDIIMKTPGISLKNIDTSLLEGKITSELNLLLKHFENLVIGVTGTKGKSTTSSLIYKVLKDSGKDVVIMGNIGLPILDVVQDVNPDTICVVEMSSHQLEYVKYSPKIAVILNLFLEHLDFYNSYQDYINAKINILKYQNKNDVCILNLDSDVLMTNIESLDNLKSKKIYISSNDIFSATGYIGYVEGNQNIQELVCSKDNYAWDTHGKRLYNFSSKRLLIGKHNEHNIMVALAIAKELDLDMRRVEVSINEFKPLPHRLEFVGTFADVDYYNDSIATIPESTIKCIETLENLDTIIVGGMDRGVDYTELSGYIVSSNIRNVICMYATGDILFEQINNILYESPIKKNVIKVKDIKEAVEISKEVTNKGYKCALSPAAASYGNFKNFEERGNIFKDLVFEIR